MNTLPLINSKPLFLDRTFPSLPAANDANYNESKETYTAGSTPENLGLMDPALMAKKAKATPKREGLQMGAKALALFGAFSAIVGLAGCGSPPPAPKTETVTKTTEAQAPAEAATEVTAAEIKREAPFSEGRELLLNRSERVTAGQFNPDPSMATEIRGKRAVYEESYIATLVDRDVTQVPEGAPRFTAVGADESQSSKLYFNGELQPAEWGGGTVKSGNFATRPTRMNGRGAGISDKITQHQLSCVYNLEEAATIDGVQLEPGMYRLITLAPSSNVATRAMDRGVCPGHRLESTGSGISGDYQPVQTNKDGEQLYVNADDIVQIWTLTAQEAAQYQN